MCNGLINKRLINENEYIMLKKVFTLSLVISVLFGNVVNAGEFYNFCPYCGSPIGNCCQENGCGGYALDNNYNCQENECVYSYNVHNEYDEEKKYHLVCLYSFVTVGIIFIVAVVILILSAW